MSRSEGERKQRKPCGCRARRTARVRQCKRARDSTIPPARRGEREPTAAGTLGFCASSTDCDAEGVGPRNAVKAGCSECDGARHGCEGVLWMLRTGAGCWAEERIDKTAEGQRFFTSLFSPSRLSALSALGAPLSFPFLSHCRPSPLDAYCPRLRLSSRRRPLRYSAIHCELYTARRADKQPRLLDVSSGSRPARALAGQGELCRPRYQLTPRAPRGYCQPASSDAVLEADPRSFHSIVSFEKRRPADPSFVFTVPVSFENRGSAEPQLWRVEVSCHSPA